MMKKYICKMQQLALAIVTLVVLSACSGGGSSTGTGGTGDKDTPNTKPTLEISNQNPKFRIFNADETGLDINSPSPSVFPKGRLWITDGTASGTKKLHSDVRIASYEFLNAVHYFDDGKKALFAGDTAQNGTELWVTDGTTSGTKRLTERKSSTDLTPSGIALNGNAEVQIVRLGDVFYFIMKTGPDARDQRLYKTDGTVAGTQQVLGFGHDPRINGYFLSYYCDNIFSDGKRLYLNVNDQVSPHPKAVVSFDPSKSGNARFALLKHNAELARVFNSKNHSFGVLAGSKGLFKIDATTAKVVNTPDNYISAVPPNGQSRFQANIEEPSMLLVQKTINLASLRPFKFASDGTFTEMTLTGISTTPAYHKGNSFFFDDKLYALNRDKNTALRIEANGAAKRLNVGAQAKTFNMGYDAVKLANKMLFIGINENTHYKTANCKGREPWVLDSNGLDILKDINPASCATTNPLHKASNSLPLFLGKVGGKLGDKESMVFLAYDPASSTPKGYELWITNGTPDGTKILKDIAPNSENGVSNY